MNAVLVVFLILSIGSGHDTPPVFSVEPRSSIIGFVAILWRQTPIRYAQGYTDIEKTSNNETI
jgi:hypothetical protein